MITELTLKNFRGFERHVVPLRPLTIIVGKNNAGKSTIVEALRLLSAVTSRYQSLDYRRLPKWLDRNRRERAVFPSTKDFDFRHDAVFHRLGEAPAEITAKFASGEKVEIFIGSDLEVFGIIKDANGNVIESKGQANRVRLPQVSILPQIGPLQEEERILEEGYIRRSLSTSRSSLHFRNQLHYMRQHFPHFKELVEETWHGLSLDAVELKELPPADRGASLFIRDVDFSAEVGWVGHGLQMWLQTMWFLTHCAGANSMILDEPDVYMHADLQRRLIRLLRARKHQTIVATHSIEIMSEVEPDEVLVIDRRRAKSYFAGKHPTVQSLLESIGSIHNIQLARLGASRRFLMVEGDDIDFLKRFQNTIFPDSQTPIDTIPHKSIGGWNGWERAVGCATFLNDEAGESIKPYCLLDSDYQTPDTIKRRQKSAADHKVQLHIWKRKEIENYLLIPAAILRLILRGAKPSGEKPALQDIETKLEAVAEQLRMDTFNAMATAFQEEDRSGGVTGANRKADARLNAIWKKSSGKLSAVCGKEVIHKMSEWSNRKYGVSFNAVKLARELSASEIDDEVKTVLSAIESCDDFTMNKAI